MLNGYGKGEGDRRAERARLRVVGVFEGLRHKRPDDWRAWRHKRKRRARDASQGLRAVPCGRPPGHADGDKIESVPAVMRNGTSIRKP